eukprot:TRINITY_DN17866_c0_g1_i2.p1 TRINITY_DN17866_c0_g1~~TRINITY_DN17866_c0_g1_i2.p1  ORF type:complete len:461 (+),score=83.67 TRINITY_DN17866_c0_g1_i2:27-1385(+)
MVLFAPNSRCTAVLVSLSAFLTLPASAIYEEGHLLDQDESASVPPGFLGTLQGHKSAIYALAVSPDGRLASGSKDGLINIWNLTSAAPRKVSKPVQRLHGHTQGVTALAFVPASSGTGEALVSGSADNSTVVWDIASGKVLHNISHPRTVFAVGIARSGIASQDRQVTTGCWDGVVRVFSLDSGDAVTQLNAHRGGIYALAYSPLDSSLLATASADRTVKIWDMSKPRLLWSLRGHKDHVTSVDWSPTQTYMLATGGWDRRFRLWTLSADQIQACREEASCTNDLQPLHMARHPQLVWHVAFAPSGLQVAACHGAVGQSPTVVIYDVASGRMLRRLGRHKDTPLTITYSPSGQYLISAGMDRKVLLYAAEHPGDDMPQGDPDDEEERLRWLQDMEEYRMDRNSSSNASALAALAQKLALLQKNRSRDISNSSDTADSGPWMPHPMSGMAAFL